MGIGPLQRIEISFEELRDLRTTLLLTVQYLHTITKVNPSIDAEFMLEQAQKSVETLDDILIRNWAEQLK